MESEEEDAPVEEEAFEDEERQKNKSDAKICLTLKKQELSINKNPRRKINPAGEFLI